MQRRQSGSVYGCYGIRAFPGRGTNIPKKSFPRQYKLDARAPRASWHRLCIYLHYTGNVRTCENVLDAIFQHPLLRRKVWIILRGAILPRRSMCYLCMSCHTSIVGYQERVTIHSIRRSMRRNVVLHSSSLMFSSCKQSQRVLDQPSQGTAQHNI